MHVIRLWMKYMHEKHMKILNAKKKRKTTSLILDFTK